MSGAEWVPQDQNPVAQMEVRRLGKRLPQTPESQTGTKIVQLADDAIALLKRRWDETRSPGFSRGASGAEGEQPLRRTQPYLDPGEGEG